MPVPVGAVGGQHGPSMTDKGLQLSSLDWSDQY